MIIKDPKAEISINPVLIKRLLNVQFPQLSNLSITFLDAGWDNENYRLGAQYIIRLPRRQAAATLILNEINWLPKIKNALSIDIPAPIFVGKPTTFYPWHWSIIPWFEGKTANLAIPNANAAIPFVQCLKTLHQLDATSAPINQHRGVPLKEKAKSMQERINRLKEKTKAITPAIEKLWAIALATPFTTKKQLLHGDLHPRNIIVKDGQFKALIDWGDITDGDAATDLASLWMLFPNPATRQNALQVYDASQHLIQRAIGWAIFFGVILLDTGLVSNPQHAEIGALTLQNIHSTI